MTKPRARSFALDRLFPLLLAAGALLWAPARSLGAAPDWLSANLTENVSAENPNITVVQLVNSTEVRYLSADQTRRQWRAAMKIITEAGRAQARLGMPYNAETDHIVSARAWIVSPDGRKTKAYGRSDFLDSIAQYNQYNWNAQRILVFDGTGLVGVGGVLAWEIQIETPSGIVESDCAFLNPLNVMRTVFEVIPPPGGKFEWHATSPKVGRPVAGGSPGALRWEMAAQAPFLTGRPPGFQPNPLEVSVRLAPAPGGAITWEERSRLAAGIIEPRMDSTGAVKAQADAVVAGKAARWERIRALAEFVQRDIVYLAITLDKDRLAGFRPHPAPEVLRNRYGDCKDKATLLISMLRAAGESGFAVLLNGGNPTATAADWPSLGFNHVIVAVPADDSVPAGWPVVDAGALGRLVIFDPTDSTTPLGVLSPGDQGGFGLVVAARQGRLISLPLADGAHSTFVRRTQGEIGPQGELRASIDETRTGLLAAEEYGIRHGLRADQFKRRLATSLHLAIPLVQGLELSDTWDAAACRYQLSLKFSAQRFARAVGSDTLLVAPQILPGAAPLVAWRTQAEGVVWLQANAVEEDVRLTLPAGYAVEELPEAWDEDLTSASGHLTYRTEGRDLVCRWRLSRRGGFYRRSEYELLRQFYQKLHEAQRRPVVLRHTAAPPAS